MGPVGIADRVNATDIAMMRRTCNTNGTLLQPSRPIATTDAAFGTRRKGNNGQSMHQGHVWRTLSAIPDAGGNPGTQNAWHFFLGWNLAAAYTVDYSDFAPAPQGAPAYLTQPYFYRGFGWPSCRDGDLVAATDPPKNGSCVGFWGAGSWGQGPALAGWGNDVVGKNGTIKHEVMTVSPVLSNGFVVIGETSKFTAVSPNRFAAITPAVVHRTLSLEVAGAAGESVSITVLVLVAASQWKVKIVVANFTDAETRSVVVDA